MYIDEIRSKIENQLETKALLIVGKYGSSKSTILMELMWHFFDLDYMVLYNFGNFEIKNILTLAHELLYVLSEEKVFIAIDNVHSKNIINIFPLLNNTKTLAYKIRI